MQEVRRKMASAEAQRQQKMVGEEQLRVQRASEIGDEIGQLWEAKETADSLTWDDGKVLQIGSAAWESPSASDRLLRISTARGSASARGASSLPGSPGGAASPVHVRANPATATLALLPIAPS